MPLKPSPTFLRLLVLLAVFSLAPVTLYILYTRTGGPASGKELVFQRNLRFSLMAGSDTVDLATLTAWPWEKVCALDAALTEDELNAVVGFSYKDYAELHWLHLADYWTLFFVDSERQASWGLARPVVPIRISRKEHADLALPPGVKGQCVGRGDGRLQLSRKTVPVGVTPVTASLVDSVD